jgi:hypothetical protein
MEISKILVVTGGLVAAGVIAAGSLVGYNALTESTASIAPGASLNALYQSAPAGVETVFQLAAGDYGDQVIDDEPSKEALAGVGIWNVALTQSHITSLAGGISPYYINNNSLIACLNLCGTSSPEPDIKGTNNGTLTGTNPAPNPPLFTGCPGDSKFSPVIFGRGAA